LIHAAQQANARFGEIVLKTKNLSTNLRMPYGIWK